MLTVDGQAALAPACERIDFAERKQFNMYLLSQFSLTSRITSCCEVKGLSVAVPETDERSIHTSSGKYAYCDPPPRWTMIRTP